MQKEVICTDGLSSIALGRQGDVDRREVIFHLPQEIASGKWVLTHSPAGGRAAYEVPLDVRGETLVWKIGPEDVDVPGNGLALLRCLSTNGQTIWRRKWTTVVQNAANCHAPVTPHRHPPWGELLVQILSAGTYTEDQTENIAALAEILGVAAPKPMKKLAAPVIRLENDKPKLTTPVIRLVEQEVSTTAVLGQAILGEMILGEGIPPKLATPAIRLETVEETRKLSKPTIYLQEIVSAFKLATPVITLQEG